MVYHVKNNGGQRTPVRSRRHLGLEKTSEPVTFSPQFVLESSEYKKAYLDRLVPVAIPAIQQKEDPTGGSCSTASRLPPSRFRSAPSGLTTASGASWQPGEDLDPAHRLFFTLRPGADQRLQWVDPPGAKVKPTDPPGTGSTITQKTLVLNFGGLGRIPRARKNHSIWGSRQG